MWKSSLQKTILTLYTAIESQARTWMDIHFMEYKHTIPLIRRTVPLEKYREKKLTNMRLPYPQVMFISQSYSKEEQNRIVCVFLYKQECNYTPPGQNLTPYDYLLHKQGNIFLASLDHMRSTSRGNLGIA